MIDQITKHREKKSCGGCGTLVVHVQLVSLKPQKTYHMVPIGHTRPDGARCTHLADMRGQAWKLKTLTSS